VIFVDTGAWFAAFVPNDADHAMADAWLETNTELLVTADYVIDEVLTLMKIRGEFRRALRVGASLFAEEITQIAWVLPDDIQQGLDHGVGHPLSFSLARYSLWRTERYRGISTDSRIAVNMDRGFCPKNRSTAVVPSERVSRKVCTAVRQARFLG
jgi:hypothetical protein